MLGSNYLGLDKTVLAIEKNNSGGGIVRRNLSISMITFPPDLQRVIELPSGPAAEKFMMIVECCDMA